MTRQKMISYFFNYLLLLPAMTFCWLALKDHLKIPSRRLYQALGAAVVLLSGAALAFSCLVRPILPYFFLLAATVPGCLFCFKVSNLEWYKVLALFLDVTALIAAGGRLDRSIDVLIHPNGTPWDGSTYGLLAEWIFLAGMLLLFWSPMKKQFSWLLGNFHDRWLWRLFGFLAGTIAAFNLLMTPLKNSNMMVGRVYSVSVVGSLLLFASLLLANFTFYFAARGILQRDAAMQHSEQLKSEMRMMECRIEEQAKRQQLLLENQEAMRVQRHDLRHQLAVIRSFSQEADNTALTEYLDSLAAAIPVDRTRTYCENPAANAIVCHYAAQAESQGVELNIRIVVPSQTETVSDRELCVLLGNLMENAVEACGRMTTGRRFIRLRSRLQYGVLTLTMDNSFNGQIARQDGRFLSSKRDAVGTGLQSVAVIAEKHGGHVKFDADGTTFRSSVYVNI